MRVLMLTTDPETARAYLDAAQTLNRLRFCIIDGEAKALELVFRDPFDIVIVDEAEKRRIWRRNAPNCNGRFVLLFRGPSCIGVLPESVVYGFARSHEPIEVLRRIDALPNVQPIRRCTEVQISAQLQRIGVPVSMKGFLLLKEAIRLLLRIDRPTQVRMLEDVYGMLAESMQMNASIVEHAMRHAIEASWLRADVNDLEAVFGYTVSADRAAPSNAGFLFLLTDRIKTEYGRGTG